MSIRTRCLPLLLALIVGVTPSAVQLCQIACQTMGHPSVERSCHGHASAATHAGGPTLKAAPHVCDHAEGVLASASGPGPVLPLATMTDLPRSAMDTAMPGRFGPGRAEVPRPPLLLQAPLRL